MKALLTIGLTSACVLSSLAQTRNYTFVREGGAMTYLDPTTQTVTEHEMGDDYVLPAKVKIGFPFKFNGHIYDSVGISENGYIWFGPAQAEDMEGLVNPITNTLPEGVAGVVCAFGIDMHPAVMTDLTTTIRSATIMHAGSANNFIVEWRNTTRIEALGNEEGEDTISYQIQLFAFESDRVQITYGDMRLNPTLTSYLSVGMKGASEDDFAIRMTDATHDWNNNTAGTDLNSTCTLNADTNPTLGTFNYMTWLNNNPTGIKNAASDISFAMYPVPAADMLHVTMPAKHTVLSYTISNIEGKVVSEGISVSAGITVNELNKGMYMLTIRTTEGSATKRFVKL
jgi:hypothetical protein